MICVSFFVFPVVPLPSSSSIIQLGNEKKIDELFHNLETRIVNLLNRKNIYEDSNDFI